MSWVRRGCIAIAAAVALVVAVPPGQRMPDGPNEFPLAGLWELVTTKPGWALDRPTTPRQERGGSLDGAQSVGSETTRANGGNGRAPGTVKGALEALQQTAEQDRSEWKTPGKEGYVPGKSTRIAEDATATSDLFRNPDGSVTERHYQHPVNFKGPDGKMRPIDTKLVPGPNGRWQVASSPVQVSLAGLRTQGWGAGSTATADPSATPAGEAAARLPASELASITFPGGQVFGFGLQGAQPTQATVEGSTAKYPNILANTDIELTATRSGSKETIVLKSRGAVNSWVFPLNLQGLTARLESNGSVSLLDKVGSPVAAIPQGWMQDSKMQPDGEFTTSQAVTYELITVDGRQALKVTADRAWLDDPARIYPVRVDPTASLWDDLGDAYVDSTSVQNINSLGVGCYDADGAGSGGCNYRRSFLSFTNFGTYAYGAPNNNLYGKRITGATLHLFHTWAEDCTTFSNVYAHRVTQWWSASNMPNGKWPGASIGGRIGEVHINEQSAACGNSGGNRALGRWWQMPITDLSIFNDWSKDANVNYGIALVPQDENNRGHWKRFTSRNHDPANGNYAPYIDFVWAENDTPQIEAQYPTYGQAVATLTPELLVASRDADSWPQAMTHTFQVYDKNGLIADSGAIAAKSWTVPSGKLKWNESYQWTVIAFDGAKISQSQSLNVLSTAVPQAPITSGLSQNADKGFEPSIGNYTTSAVDAQVPSPGPALSIARSYNSRDPRTASAFGAGWTSILDSRVVESEQKDASAKSVAVTVTYPTGQDVTFGRDPVNGTFVAPPGRFSSFKWVTGPDGYELVDKDGTKYTFTKSIVAGTFGLTAVTDAQGRKLTLDYDGSGKVVSLTGAKGRKLWFTWTASTPPRVATVKTDPSIADDAASANTWQYTYTGEKLTKVCPPTDSVKCTQYEYGTNSLYPTAVMDAGPHTYLRLSEPVGAATAASSIVDNADTGAGVYSNVTLGQPSSLPGSTAKTASFGGTNSSVLLPRKVALSASYQSVSLRFKTSTMGGVLLSYQKDALAAGTTAGNYTPSLYIGATTGKLHGQFWHGTVNPFVSATSVADGQWHDVVLVAAGDKQWMYLDGVVVDPTPRSGVVKPINWESTTNQYLGAGFIGGAWPDQAHQSGTDNTGYATHFNGLMSDFALYTRPLSAAQIALMRKSALAPSSPLTKSLRPLGGTSAEVTYDAVTGLVTQLKDANNAKWHIAKPELSGAGHVYATTVLAAAPSDYYRMKETGVSEAVNEVNGGVATYGTGVTLGVDGGPFGDDVDVASFNGTSTYVKLPKQDYPNGNTPSSVSLWFRTTTAGGVLYGAQALELPGIGGGYQPGIYVDTAGKLRGGYWPAGQIVSPKSVTDGVWHHVALTSTGTSQSLYLDGGLLETKASTPEALGANVVPYIGAGRWKDWPATTGDTGYFKGEIGEFAYFRSELKKEEVAAQFAARDRDRSAGAPLFKAAVTAATPLDYFQLAETSGTQAANQVGGGPVATYNGVELGVDGPFGAAGAGATFNGTSSFVTLPTRDMTATGPASVGMWFKVSPGRYGVLYSYQAGAVTNVAGTGGWVPALYVGTDGLLRGKFWEAAGNQITSGTAVSDGQWHHVVLAASINSQSMYLDGIKVGTINAALVGFGATHAYVGAGKWTNWASSISDVGYFGGQIAEFAYYNHEVNQAQVAAQFTARDKAKGVPAKFIKVSGPGELADANNTSTTHIYDTMTGRKVQEIDPRGGVTRYGYDTGGFLHSTTDPNGNMTVDRHDVRGNVIAKTTCQDRSENICSTVYKTYFPDATTKVLTPDPRNDVLLTERDGRSASETDNTYLTTYTYDAFGNRTEVKDPLGRVTKTGYTNGAVIQADLTGLSGTGRYVRVYGTARGIAAGYSIFDLEVYGSYGNDLALGRPVTTSSNQDSTLVGSNAVDGNPATRWSSAFSDPQSIYVDLGASQSINRVKINWEAAYGKDYVIQVSNDAVGWTTIKTVTNQTPDTIPAGLPWRTTTPAGAVQTLSYLLSGDVFEMVDAAGLRTRHGYDGLGRVTTKNVFIPGNRLDTAFVYDKQSRVVQQTDPKVVNRVTGAQHTAVTTTVYDADGNVTSQSIADSSGGDATRTVTNVYNALGQLESTADAAGKTRSFTHDLYGNKLTETDPTGAQMAYTYDATGLLLTTKLIGWTGDPNNPTAPTDLPTESRAYDPAGRLATITDAMGWVTEHKYTDNGLLASVIRKNPSSGATFVIETTSYDAAGNAISKVTNNGTNAATIAVDAASRPKSQTVDPSGVNRTTTFTYGTDDTVISTKSSDGSGATSYMDATYDVAGRKTSESVRTLSAGEPDSWWQLNENYGTTASDSMPAGRHASLYGPVAWADGGASFSGNSDIAYPQAPVVDTIQSFTVSAWAKVPTTGGGGVVVAQDGAWRSGFELYTGGNWAANKPCGDGNWGAIWLDSGVPVAAGQWTHVALVFDTAAGNVLRLYVNGVERTSGTNCGAGFQANGAFTIGRGKYNNAVEGPFIGGIDNVQAYRRAVSSSDIASLHAKGRNGGALGSNATTSWTYDKRGLQTSMTDPNGNVTNYEYDEAGQPVTTTMPAVTTEENGGAPVSSVPTTALGYNTFGEAVESRDTKGRVTTIARDANGQATSTTLPSYTPPGGSPITAVSKTVYDASGQVIETEDPLGNKTLNVYDQLGRLAKTTAPNTGVTKFTYNLNGDQLSVTNANGARSEGTYDFLGRKVTTTAIERMPAAAHVTTYGYDTAGRLASVTPPGRASTTYKYNAVGETTEVKDGAGNATTFTYDFAGRKKQTTSPDGSKQTVTYDAAGRPLSQQTLNPIGGVLATTSATYDAKGQMLTSTDARGVITSLTYDPTGLVTAVTQPITVTDAINTSFGYDLGGNQTRFTDGRNNKFVTTYNTWGKAESQIEPGGATFTISYDAAGRPVSQSAPGGVSVTNTYNSVGQVVGQTGTGADAPTASRTFGYDLAGQMTSAQEGSSTTNLTYTDRGLLSTVSGAAGASSFAWTPDGLMASRQDAAGTSTYGYDTAGRLSTVADASTGHQGLFEYNSLSQVTKITYGSNGNRRSFSYDGLRRLATDSLAKPDGGTIGSITYNYDANGNETSKTTVGFAGASSNTYTYDLANRLTSWNNGSTTTAYEYDKSGNRTKIGSRVFTYDTRNQLTSDGDATYTYTPRGTMSGSTVGTVTTPSTFDAYSQQITQGSRSYTYDGMGRVLAASGGVAFAYSGTGNHLASDGTAAYSRDPSGDLFGVKAGGTGVFAWTDLHDDVVAQFNSTATTLTGSRTYNPFGSVTASAGIIGNLGYQSGWTDPSTSRVNMHARWYNPETAQFGSRDTATVSPVPNSIRANRFAYGDGNPMTVTDPTGHWGSWLKNKVSNAWNSTKSAVTSAASWVGSKVSSAYNYVANEARELRDWARDKVKQVKDWGVQKVNNAKDNFKRKVDQYKQKAQTFYNNTKKAVAPYFAAAKTLIDEGKQKLADAYKATETWVKEHKAEIAGFVVGAVVGIGCGALIGWTGVGAVACGALAGAAGSLVTGLIKGKSGWDLVGDVALGAVSGAALGGLGSMLGSGISAAVGGGLKTAAGRFAAGFKAEAGNILNGFKGLAGKAGDAIGGAVRSFSGQRGIPQITRDGLTGGAKSLADKLTKSGVADLGRSFSVKSIAQASEYLNAEIGFIQNMASGRMRAILGSDSRIGFSEFLKENDVILGHTHPVFSSVAKDFTEDLSKKNPLMEVVIDWGGNVTHYAGQEIIENPLKPLVNAWGHLVGHRK